MSNAQCPRGTATIEQWDITASRQRSDKTRAGADDGGEEKFTNDECPERQGL